MHQRQAEYAGIEQQAAAFRFSIGHAVGNEESSGTFEAVKINSFDDSSCLGVMTRPVPDSEFD